MDEVLLHQRDEAEEVVGERVGAAHVVERPQQPRVDLAQHLAHDDPLLEAVQEEAVAVGRVVAEQPLAEAVER